MKAWKLNVIFTFIIAGMAIAAIVCGVYLGARKGKVRKLRR